MTRSMEVVRDLRVRGATREWLETQRSPRTWKDQGSGKEEQESPTQDLCLRLEYAGLLPYRLLIISIVVVDAPVRGHVLTP